MFNNDMHARLMLNKRRYTDDELYAVCVSIALSRELPSSDTRAPRL